LMRGSYALVLVLEERKVVETGALGSLDLEAGTYIYCGSAMGGLEPRLGRHFRGEKKLHWHIDRLLQAGKPMGALLFEGENRECAAAAFLMDKGRPVQGFGCSDCHCPSHLFRVPEHRLTQVLDGLRRLAEGND
jgi:Uri superfamily endonuclease